MKCVECRQVEIAPTRVWCDECREKLRELIRAILTGIPLKKVR